MSEIFVFEVTTTSVDSRRLWLLLVREDLCKRIDLVVNAFLPFV